MFNVAHFSFTVVDLDRSIAFYRDLLGMRLLRRADRQGTDISSIVAFENAHLKIGYLEISRGTRCGARADRVPLAQGGADRQAKLQPGHRPHLLQDR